MHARPLWARFVGSRKGVDWVSGTKQPCQYVSGHLKSQ